MLKKELFDRFLKRKFIVNQTNYPIQNGFLDFGPALVALKAKLIEEWRNYLVEENFYEIETSLLLPYEVLKNSGHVDKFCDIILTNGVETYRADHLIEDKVGEWHLIPEIDEKVKSSEELLNQLSGKISKLNLLNDSNRFTQFSENDRNRLLEGYSCNRIHINNCGVNEIDFIVKVNNLCADNSNFLPAKYFNLIFGVNAGTAGKGNNLSTHFLRPELAQSQFTNFKRISEYSNGTFPFATFMIGPSYRNEINAKGGMIRTREFYQAEIEYFTDTDKHPLIDDVLNVEAAFLSNTSEEAVILTIKEALSRKIIKSEVIGYFIGKTTQFMLSLGFEKSVFRFRQHKDNEMAHYAKDCWDCEIRSKGSSIGGGWIECVGIANRGCFDLNCHKEFINPNLSRTLESSKVVKYLEFDKNLYAKLFKARIPALQKAVNDLSQEDIKRMQNFSEDRNIKFIFDNQEVILTVKDKTVMSETFIPTVIEPSFGISRILYCLLEHSFNVVEGRSILQIKPHFAVKHVSISSLRNSVEYDDSIKRLRCLFKAKSNKPAIHKLTYEFINRSCSIGKKYACADELGIPFFITLDPSTIQFGKVTIRERDSCEQVSVDLDDSVDIISALIDNEKTWADIYEKFSLKKE